MVVLYLTSSAAGAGKTGVAAGIGRRLLSLDKKVGYLRPTLMSERSGASNDSAIVRRFFGLGENEDVLSPTFVDDNAMRIGLKPALDRVSAGKDVVIVEGIAGHSQNAIDAATSVSAKIIGVEAYASDFQGPASYYKNMTGALAGIVLNKVPASRMKRVQTDYANHFTGVRLVGSVPEDRSLIALSVGELAKDVGGSIVRGADRSSAVVENIMLAAMSPDHGPDYYSLKDNKAVIVRSERPDMQLAALETPTTCLVVTGEQPPIQMVLRRAEANNVPVVSTKDDVKTVVVNIEAALREARLDDRRIVALADLMGKNLDFAAIV